MTRLIAWCGAVALLCAVGITGVQARGDGRTLVVVMTNDLDANAIQVYDARTMALVQTLPTQGKGGVGGNANGVRQHDGEFVAAVNNGSNTVAVFRRNGNRLRFETLVATTSAPVSVDFGNGHMYVAGATSVDSFLLRGNGVAWMDGTTVLMLAGGGVPGPGSTAQVGVLNERQLLVTLKGPDPGTVDVIRLRRGAVTGADPVAVPVPPGSSTPFGFSVYPDGTAVITLAATNQDGLFRDGAFTAVVAAGQGAPCWMTRAGKYLFTANTPSRSISRLIGTGANVFVDETVAAEIQTGGPTDLDASQGVLGVMDHGNGESHLSIFSIDAFGELTLAGAPITIGVANANGVAIMAPTDRDDD